MKLDNIIYDTQSLANAITEQWSTDSPTFRAMYPSDTATSLVNVMAAYGSMLQYCLVSALANCYTETAFSESAIYQLASTLGNSLHGNVSSQVTVNVTKNNFIGMDIVIPAETQFEIDGKKFFNPNAIICPANVETVTEVVLVQGEYITVNMTSTGVENEKFYFSTDFKCNHNYVQVFVNGEEWIVDESFLAYDKKAVYDASQMNVCVLKTDPDGRSYIKVGNNQLGNLPLTGSNIQIKYVSNEGEAGNISETEKEGNISTVLTFMDTSGNTATLDVTVTTTTTAYGGFSKQSIEVLQYSSPMIFASGHRAIRRQDYEALLLNKCGYLTCGVWGEYEEANKVGAYDSLMMNMVYYTGIKTFQTYPYFIVGWITDKQIYGGMLNSVRGFWGSFTFQIKNLTNVNNVITVQDTGARGQLFINNNATDPRDSLLPDWLNTTDTVYRASLGSPAIATGGSGYKVNEELLLQETNSELRVRVTSITEAGSVETITLLSFKTTQDWTKKHPSAFSTIYPSVPGSGTGLTVNIQITSSIESTLIYTNDDRGEEPAPSQLNPIINARSDQDPDLYYQSLYEPSLLQPVQIIISYSEAKGLAGIKFQATNPERGCFIGTVAMFGTNIDPIPSLDNIRNSEDWEKIINRTFLNTPWGNENDNWTDWIPTNNFLGTQDQSGNPEYNRYKHYVIEFYSVDEDNTVGDPFITFGKFKMLYEKDASVLYYDLNGVFTIQFPTAGSPGPGGSEEGYLTSDLLNTAAFPMYGYAISVQNVTTSNGYRDGNKLAYIFKNGDLTIPFVVEVVNIDNQVFAYYVNGSSVLSGTEYVSLPQPVSLDTTKLYTVDLVLESGRIPVGKGGSGYKPNDIVNINDSDGYLQLRVTTVDSYGTVLNAVWLKNESYGKEYTGEHQTTLVSSPEGSSGTGLVVELSSTLKSGVDGVAGSGGTIQITSTNNLQLEASFTGNRIDTQDINYLDQPIISQYNHFTTYLEFKQPEITQVTIRVEAELSTTATITSGIILQNIKNNIQNLFNITPDYIGKGLKLSDIYTAVMKTEHVTWCRVLTPLDNIDVEKNGLLIASNITVVEKIPEYK